MYFFKWPTFGQTHALQMLSAKNMKYLFWAFSAERGTERSPDSVRYHHFNHISLQPFLQWVCSNYSTYVDSLEKYKK